MRRCPHCGARNLWRKAERAPGLPLVLLTARLCGIIAGVQLGLLALLCGDHRAQQPSALVTGTVLLPVAGYLVAGFIAAHIAPEWRRGYLALVVAANLGLLAATVAAELGLGDPVALLGVALAGAALGSGPVVRAINIWVDEQA